MKSLNINKSDKKTIENILNRIANQYGIDSITSVNIDLNKIAGIIKYKQAAGLGGMAGVGLAAKGVTGILGFLAGIPGLGWIAAAISALTYGLGSDPEIRTVIENWVDLAIEKHGLPPENRNQYIQVTLSAIAKGATTVAQQWAEQHAEKQKATANVNKIIKEAQAPKDIYTEVTEEPVTKGILDKAFEFGEEVVNNAVFKLESLWGGQTTLDLQNKIADLLISKKKLNPQYKSQFVEYLSSFAKQGFQDIKQEVEKRKEEKAKDTKQPTVPKEIPEASKGIEPAIAESPVKGPDILQAVTPTIKPGTAPTYDPNNMNDPNNPSSPLHPRYDEPGFNAGNRTDAQIEAQRQRFIKEHPAPANIATTPATTAAYNQERAKYAMGWLSLGKYILKYGTEVYVIYKALKEIIFGNENTNDSANMEENIVNAIADDIIKEGNFFDIAEKMLDIANKVLTDVPEAKNIIDLLIEKTGKSPEEIKNGVEKIIYGVSDFLDKLKNEELVEKESSLYTTEYLKVNSNTFTIKKGSRYYNELENILTKFAEDQNIDNVFEIELELSNEIKEATFRQVFAFDFNIINALAAGVLNRFVGDEESWGDTAIKSVAAGLTNTGFTAASTVAKYFGGDLKTQLLAGGIGAYVWDKLFTPSEDDRVNKLKQETLNTAYTEAMQDPETKALVDLIVEKTGRSPQEAWLFVLGKATQGMK